MGTDIHVVEECWNGRRWEFSRAIDINRNYVLFYILAGVCGDSGDDIPKLADRRGLPNDLDPKSSDDYRLGDHSHSWLLLSELRSFNWKGHYAGRGLIPLHNYFDAPPWSNDKRTTFENWDRHSPPDEYSQGYHCDRLCILSSMSEADQVLVMTETERAKFAPNCDYFWTWVTWSESIADRCSEFVELLADWEGMDGHDVRIVFGFDS